MHVATGQLRPTRLSDKALAVRFRGVDRNGIVRAGVGESASTRDTSARSYSSNGKENGERRAEKRGRFSACVSNF